MCADRSFRFALLLGVGERKAVVKKSFGLVWLAVAKLERERECVWYLLSCEWQLLRCDGPNVAPLARPPLVRRS